MKNIQEIKERLYQECLNLLDKRLKIEADAIEVARCGAANEDKCSCGDKYETTRSMLQLEQEKYSMQLANTLKLKKSLTQLDIKKTVTKVSPGALVLTDIDNFFFAIGSDEIEIDGEEYQPLSFLSPLGAAFAGKKVGDSIEFRGSRYEIESIC